MAQAPKFDIAATGGTFDIIHRGHIALLSASFAVARHVIIGLTSDEMVSRKQKKPLQNFDERRAELSRVLDAKFPGSSYRIESLYDDFGPAVCTGKVKALVVSEETRPQGDALNRLRARKGLGPVQVIVVPMVLADDGVRISTSRIKNSEIYRDGRLARPQSKQSQSF